MKKLLGLLATAFTSLLLGNLQAADYPFVVPLSMPSFSQLTTTLNTTSGPVGVFVVFDYEPAGRLHCSTNSTLNGRPVTCRATVTKSSRGISFTITLRSTNAPWENLTLTGMLGTNGSVGVYMPLVRAIYTGTAGRFNSTTQEVTISAPPANANIVLSPQISTRNVISGTGKVSVAYSDDLMRTGSMRGSVTTNRLSFTLTQSPRTVSFSGVRSNDQYVGTLTINALPARETIRNFRIPASAFPVRAGRATFRGSVAIQSGQTPTNAPGVKVNVQSDLNGDGKITGAERKTVITDRQGRYTAPFNVLIDRQVVVEFVKSNYAQFSATYPVVTPGAVVVRNTLLQPLTSLTVSSNMARTQDGRLALENLPPGIRSVQGRVFNPNTETSQFPGQFNDNQRNLLVSSVFSAIEAQDTRGRAVTNFGTNVTLCMEIPRDTWSTLGDMTNGTSQIDVPFYYYDEVSGQWKRNDTDGWLEDTNRVKIPESELANIRNGTYPGKVCSVGPIRHLSYWNVDWPVSTKTCISGVIMDQTGTNRADGATITVRGVSYTGSSSPEQITGGSEFCVEVMRSENPGEDVDRDNVTGETQQVQVMVQYRGQIYSFGPFSTPATQGTCDTGGCLQLGGLVLSEANRLTITTCTISGRVVYSGTSLGGTSTLNPGDPVVGAMVMAFDPENTELLTLCATNPACQFSTVTDANGNYSLNVSYLSGLAVIANKVEMGTESFSQYQSYANLTTCPQGPLNLQADFLNFRFLVIHLTATGGDENEAGVIISNNDIPSGALHIGANSYFVNSTVARPRPTTTGLWATLNIYNFSQGPRALGTLRLTVTSLSPLSGTWTTTGITGSGTWAEQDF